MVLTSMFRTSTLILHICFQFTSKGHPQDPLQDEIARAVVLPPRLSWAENFRKENSIRALVLGNRNELFK